MNDENTIKLIKDFPKLYKGVHMSIKENLMPFGFECGDGWFDLIYDLSKKISEYNEEAFATQVKEKFGTLRFNIAGGDDTVYDMRDEAERYSATVCEECGKPGYIASRGSWLKTLCQDCIDTKFHDYQFFPIEEEEEEK